MNNEKQSIEEVVRRFGIKPKDLTQKDIADYLRMPQAFALWSHIDHYEEYFVTRALGPTVVHRESDSITRSNFEVMGEYLRSLPFEEGEDWEFSECSHAAVGWVKHLSFRVLDENFEVTEIARYIHGIFEKLDEYSVLDEDHWCELEWEEKNDECDEALRNLLGREPTPQEMDLIIQTSAWDTKETGADTWREMGEALAEAGIKPERG